MNKGKLLACITENSRSSFWGEECVLQVWCDPVSPHHQSLEVFYRPWPALSEAVFPRVPASHLHTSPLEMLPWVSAAWVEWLAHPLGKHCDQAGENYVHSLQPKLRASGEEWDFSRRTRAVFGCGEYLGG